MSSINPLHGAPARSRTCDHAKWRTKGEHFNPNASRNRAALNVKARCCKTAGDCAQPRTRRRTQRGQRPTRIMMRPVLLIFKSMQHTPKETQRNRPNSRTCAKCTELCAGFSGAPTGASATLTHISYWRDGGRMDSMVPVDPCVPSTSTTLSALSMHRAFHQKYVKKTSF